MDNKTYLDLVAAGIFPSEKLVPLDKPFVDDRGKIQNILPTISVITSKAGSERSNHYHKEGYHYLYVVSGSMLYYERNINEDFTGEPLLVMAGEMVFTPPMKIHKTVFTEQTVLLSCAKLPKDHESHEEDLVRVKF